MTHMYFSCPKDEADIFFHLAVTSTNLLLPTWFTSSTSFLKAILFLLNLQSKIMCRLRYVTVAMTEQLFPTTLQKYCPQIVETPKFVINRFPIQGLETEESFPILPPSSKTNYHYFDQIGRSTCRRKFKNVPENALKFL